MKAKDLIIYSDMDGTMLSDWAFGPIVPEKNITAIKRFLADGGTISIASGRQYSDMLRFFPDIEFGSPLVCGNGSSLYDVKSKSIIYKEVFPFEYKFEALEYAETHKNVWIVAADEFAIYRVTHKTLGNSEPQNDIERKRISNEEYLRRDMTKIVYICDSFSEIEKLKTDIAKFESANLVVGVQSAPIYLEMMKACVSKANGVKKAVEFAGMADKTLICMGDFMNDYDMLKIADIAVCPSNSDPAIKAISKIITCDNNEGAFADLMDKILD